MISITQFKHFISLLYTCILFVLVMAEVGDVEEEVKTKPCAFFKKSIRSGSSVQGRKRKQEALSDDGK